VSLWACWLVLKKDVGPFNSPGHWCITCPARETISQIKGSVRAWEHSEWEPAVITSA